MITWMLWLWREKAMPVGEIDGVNADSWARVHYGVRFEGCVGGLCFDLGFLTGFRPGMIRTTFWTRMWPGDKT